VSPDDVTYYRRRAATERVMAGIAQREDVREIHEELARQYEALVERADIRPDERTVGSEPNLTPALPSQSAQKAARSLTREEALPNVERVGQGFR
jgi:hypothetical protein